MTDFNELPKAEILLHAGDCTNVGKEHEITQFVNWFQDLKGFDTKIFIAGNHDFGFEHFKDPYHKGRPTWIHHLLSEENLSQSDVVYLHDSSYTIDSPEFSRPIKIYGSPWQPEFYNWAFNLPRNGKELEEKWKNIPDDTDILITHGPPHGIRDFTQDRYGANSVGCELLRVRVEQINPLIHVFGHIHGAHGTAFIKNTIFINASICDERYSPCQKPFIIELNEYNGEIVASYVEI